MYDLGLGVTVKGFGVSTNWGSGIHTLEHTERIMARRLQAANYCC